jgi:hypothetical protein
MMSKAISLSALMVLAACGGNPFLGEDTPPNGEGPPGVVGTENPAAGRALQRRETQVRTLGPEYGNGFAEGFIYNATDDTFEVDGLAFDGANVYTRDDQVASLGPFQVYEGSNTFNDSVTGLPINQFLHRAVQGVSPSGNTRFAIVRTGAYIPYGFGGFLYERNGRVTLPTTGQALFSGSYAGLRDFQGRGGLEYATADMTMAIDFEDFNDFNGALGDGIQGTVFNRRVFDIDGTEITQDIIDAINADLDAASQISELPVAVFSVGPGVLLPTGEVAGNITSNVVNGGAAEPYETGKYFAIISDSGSVDAGEVVGVVVLTGDDPRFDGVVFRETGGFILCRPSCGP